MAREATYKIGDHIQFLNDNFKVVDGPITAIETPNAWSFQYIIEGCDQPMPERNARIVLGKCAPERLLEVGLNAVNRHDISYCYSDDHRAYSAGQASRDFIKDVYNMVDEPGKKLMVDAFNAKVAREFVPDAHKTFQVTSL